MAGFSTIGELSAAAAQSQTKNNPFENLVTGFQQGQQDANNLLQRKLQMQQMQVESQYKQQELNSKLDATRVDSLNKIFTTEDSVAQKVLIKNHQNMAAKYGWKDDNLLDFSKSADARAAIRGNFDPSRAGDPKYLSEVATQLNALGDDPRKIHQFIQSASDPAQKEAQTKLLLKGRQDAANDKTMETLIGHAVQSGAASPDDAKILLDPAQRGSPEFMAAFQRAATAYGSQNKNTADLKNNKVIADTQRSKATAGGDGMSTKKEDAILNNLQKTKSYSDLQSTVDQLERVKTSAVAGGNRLDLQEALGGTFRAITNSARAAGNASDKKELSTAAKQLGSMMTYFTGDREINPNDQEFKDLQNLIERVGTAAKGAQKNLAKQFLNGAMSGKQIRPDIAGGWYKGRFGEELTGAAAAKQIQGQGSDQTAASSFNVGGKSFSKDALRQQALSAKDPEKAKAMYKQITGEDL